MFSFPKVTKNNFKKKGISKDIKICLECGSGKIEELEFGISCEDCGVLLLRS